MAFDNRFYKKEIGCIEIEQNLKLSWENTGQEKKWMVKTTVYKLGSFTYSNSTSEF